MQGNCKALINLSDKIFVAGARGMAGSAIANALRQSGYGASNQGGALLTPTREELNLLDTISVDNWFQQHKPSVVVMAAAVVGGIEANRKKPAEFLLQNLQLQNNVINSAWIHGARRLLFLGSSCMYPKYAQQPIREDSLLSGPLEPTNEWYAIAKIAGLKLCEALRQQYGFDAISLVPTNLYGPGDNYHPTSSHVIPALIRRFQEAKINNHEKVTCWGTGKALREFLYATDLGNAAVFALERWNPDAKNSPTKDNSQSLNFLNVGTGNDLSIHELSILISEAVGYKGHIEWDKNKPDGAPKKLLDTSRLSRLGWNPRIELQDGIPLAVEDFRKHK